MSIVKGRLIIIISILGFIVWGLIWGFATKSVNESKGYEGGFWLGFFLSFIGLIIVACKADNRQFSIYSNNITRDVSIYGMRI